MYAGGKARAQPHVSGGEGAGPSGREAEVGSQDPQSWRRSRRQPGLSRPIQVRRLAG